MKVLEYHIGMEDKWILRKISSNIIINSFNYFLIGLIYSICYAYKYDYTLAVFKKNTEILFVLNKKGFHRG